LFRRLSSRLGRGNCYLFSRFLRFHPAWRQRGYLAQRSTREHLKIAGYNVGWHWVFIVVSHKTGRAWTLAYEPRQHFDGWRAIFHKVFYRGRVRRYDFKWGTNRTR